MRFMSASRRYRPPMYLCLYDLSTSRLTQLFPQNVQKVALERNLEYWTDFMADLLVNYTREKLVWLDEMESDHQNAMC